MQIHNKISHNLYNKLKRKAREKTETLVSICLPLQSKIIIKISVLFN